MTEQSDAKNLADTGNAGNVEAGKASAKPENQAPKEPQGNKPSDNVLSAHDDNSPAAVAERDRAASRSPGNDVPAGRHPNVNRSDSAEARFAQHDRVDAEMEKLNEQNAEGHEKNMAKAEELATEAQTRTEHARDRRAGHVPTGKQVNHNTPRVLPDGTKVWS